MAILEITLEKPALVEEVRTPDGASESTGRNGRDRSTGRGGSTSSQQSPGGRGKLVAALAVLAGVAVLAWRRKRGNADDHGDASSSDEAYDHGPDPEIGGDEGGARSKVAGAVGLTVALAGIATAVRRVRR